MNPIFFRPGQVWKTFDLYRKVQSKDNKGRVTYSGEPVFVTSFKGALSSINPNEQEKWNQMSHPVTHTILIRGRTDVQAEDIVKLGNRTFYVQKSRGHAEIGIFSVLFCEERTGV